MPLQRYPGLLGPSYPSASAMADQERTCNFILEKNESPNAPSPYTLIPSPGFTTLVTVNEGPIRGGIGDVNGRAFFVAGFRLYEWNGTTATARGTLASDANPATLCWNGPNGGQLFVTSGDQGYILDLGSNTLTTVLTSGATMGAFLDGFFLALDAATATLQISDLLNGLVWDPTQIAQRTAGPDPWVAMTVIHREIWLMGSQTSEVWSDTGAFPFPFEPIPGAFFEQGITAPFSANRDVAPLLWVSENQQGARQVLIGSGYNGARVSTHGLENALNSYTSVADAVSWTYQEEGHTFYVVSFPTGNATWVFDVTEGVWTERPFWDTSIGDWTTQRVRTHFYAFGVHVVGDRATGTLYRMGLDLFTDVGGAPMRRLRRPPRLSDGQLKTFVSEIQLVMDVGVGLNGDRAVQDVDPQAMLRTSRDGGRTWGPERWTTVGKQGAYDTRVKWRRCGSARNRVDEFTFSSAVPFRITDGFLNVEQGIS